MNEIREAERYLLGEKTAPERLLYEAKLLVDPSGALNFHIQKLIYQAVRLIGRKRLKAELNTLQCSLMSDPAKQAFQQQIEEIFREDKP